MSLLRKKPTEYFSQEEKNSIVDAIKHAEHMTSGEVRIYIESRCKYVDPVDRAKEVFAHLKMDATSHRNAVLLYIAMKDRQLAIWGDVGIHEKVGDAFWNEKVRGILGHFKKNNVVAGIVEIINEVGEMLSQFYPHVAGAKNELPDDIVFGK